MTRSPATLATLLAQAHETGDLLNSGTLPELSSARVAWLVQREGRRLHTAAGARRAGWKLGYTSVAMRTQMGVTEPNYGPVYEDMLLASGAVIGLGLTQPRVEPEIAFTLHSDVDYGSLASLPHSARKNVLESAVARIHCALEVVDSVWASYNFTWEENTADGSSAARVVLGDMVPSSVDLAAIRINFGDAPMGRTKSQYEGTGSAAMGNPWTALSWLVAQLANEGESLREGDVVITGGLTPSLPLRSGSAIRARFDAPAWSGEVEVTG